MKATREIDEITLGDWKHFVDAQAKNQMVRDRYKRNVKRENIDLSKKNVWKAFVSC